MNGLRESGSGLERNIVVELAALVVATSAAATTAGRRSLVVVIRRTALLTAAATAATAASTTTAAAATTKVTAGPAHAAAARVQHLHFVGDDFRGVAIVTRFVLPLARAQRAFDVNLGSLLEVLARDLAESPEHGDAVPLGAFLALAGLLVFPVL